MARYSFSSSDCQTSNSLWENRYCTMSTGRNLAKSFTLKKVHSCSASYIISELQTKATARRPYTPTRRAKIRNTDSTKCWRGWEPPELSLTDRGNAERTAGVDGNLEVSYKTKHPLTVRSSSHTPGHLSEEAEHLCPLENLHPDVYSHFIHHC